MTSAAADPAARIRATLDRLAGDMPAIGLAVSGGGDSVALMHVAAEWARGRTIMVATVDHGLRAESAEEARQVARGARLLGLKHATLLWRRETEAGNLMARARDARLRLLAGWAGRNDLSAVALGHTADDQAETLMMRLARGSGIDGLAAMTEWRDAFGMRWLRPMLGCGRAELRDWLRGRGIAWADDPGNENEDFERIRIRKAIEATGLDVPALARAAAHIGEARDALSHYAALAARDADIANGRIILSRRVLGDAPSEIRRRLLVASCRWVTGADYPPRRATAMHALAAVANGSRVTLDGALLDPSGDDLRIGREPAAARRARPLTEDGIWDRRWHVEGLRPGQRVEALGMDALAAVKWRMSGLSRDGAAASPAVRQGDALIAAPLLRAAPPLRLRPVRGAADFRTLVMAH
ncbi:MAG: tRNA lysidine(34) synthetase TilS [Paracoccus sp. (in: a-proteobacteria)]|uniref:tRNA lysidine(34) synthetase TilS n=3 Tax=Paracoccus TaxID=265 RepID=UPI002370609A|nr:MULTISPECIES: tRNA lysidine(34) synthetase TilS [unclassified Paracoccus (in: a-proteobacteria)]MCS5603874.1 tRNA lysidine(34) synthetase TilS [Paracoccus sp. (in: a-proteobacteria)]MDB2552023.1 tRNA lysidine(34) synthetase TilS [Paracoccus sp. (in: a-proteobacteria)]